MIIDSRNPIDVTIVLPSYNERNNISNVINELLNISSQYQVEILVIDDNSTDGTASLIRKLASKDRRIRLINRYNRSGLSSAIKEGFINATGDIIAVMDSDGQHEPITIFKAIEILKTQCKDLVIGSRFLRESNIKGLSKGRESGSSIANFVARLSLSYQYKKLTDYMSGFFVLYRPSCIPFVKKIDVNGFKFLYELLAISRGKLSIEELPLSFQERGYGESKLDLSIMWDYLISLIHTITLRILPRRAISFGLVGSIGVFVQLISTQVILALTNLSFEQALPISVVLAATSNYLINNLLTFRTNRLKNIALIRGLFKFLLVASLPILANIGLTSSFYKFISPNTFLAQMAGIIVVFIWNYAASSRLVWNN